MSYPLVPVDLYGVIVHDATTNADWLDASTLRYNTDGARQAWQEHAAQRGATWRESNKPVRIRRFTLVEAAK